MFSSMRNSLPQCLQPTTQRERAIENHNTGNFRITDTERKGGAIGSK